jgi:uncharacterized protein
LFQQDHVVHWNLVKDCIRAVVPHEQWKTSEAKLNGFQAGLGTILFFEDTDKIKELQASMPIYADKVPQFR